MNDKIFWDSNLWIYLFIKSENSEDIRKKEHLKMMLKITAW